MTAFLNKLNPITVQNMFYNILCKAGNYGRAISILPVEGVVVGVPYAPADEKGFRNLLNMAVTLTPEGTPVIRVHRNFGLITPAFEPPSHDEQYKIINSLFVLVSPGIDEDPVVCLNIADFSPPPLPPDGEGEGGPV
jgi:hypothetical protein